MGIGDAPAGVEDFADVGDVVAVGILEEEEVGCLGDDDAALGEDDGRGDIEAGGEDRDLIAAAVAVGVLEDFDIIAADAVRREFVGVIDRFGDPEAAAFVPGHGDGVDDIGF